ncbi:MAG: leucine-rich repeat domain-containing protein [Gammaproteobacteria bacterium]|nr:leucine-rich repeat domain-containing protein [Gammaproteobacteria bacterium]
MRRASPASRRNWLLVVLAAYAWSVAGGDRRDIVFDCPCSAEWLPDGTDGAGTLTLRAGIQSYRATQSADLQLSPVAWDPRQGASVGSLSGRDGLRRDWSMDLPRPEVGAVVELHLLERVGEGSKGAGKWQRHEALALWPVPDQGGGGSVRFVDILTDSDGDGVGDVNERLAGTSWEDPASTPGTSVIDVLALYTAEFRALETGYPYTRILHVLSVSDALFGDSGTNLQLRIVGMSEVELDNHGWARPGSRAALMDQHGADLSVQFSPKGPLISGGAAIVGARRTSLWSDAPTWDKAGSVFVTVHELGHAMGLVHSARQGESYGAFRWSRGHYVTPRGESARLGTIMAYGARVFGGVFSSPLADCGVGPCGVPKEELDGADAVGSLDRMRFQVADHRPPQPDTDGDGFIDAADAAPDDPGDWFDVDGDGIADNADPDDDNDGTADVDDPFPLDPDEWADADGDGIGDNADDVVEDLSPFRDPALRAVVETALGKAAGAAITAADMAGLTVLSAKSRGIKDLTGLEQAHGLERLSLGVNEIADLGPLSGLTSLKFLDLRGNEVVDVSPLSALTQLQHLTLADNPLSDIAPLSDLVDCIHLDLDHTRVAFADVRRLPFFPGIRSLGLAGLGIEDTSSLADLPLQWLNLSNNPVGDLTPLSRSTSLRRLQVSGAGLTNVEPLAGLVNLVSLDLADNSVADLSPLSALVRLHRVELRGNAVADTSPLAAMTRLTSLDLLDNAVEDIGPLAGLVDMRWLRLGSNRIGDVSALSAMTKLESLDLEDNRVADLRPLEGLVDVKSLHLAGNRIADVSPLSEMSSLESLDLDRNKVEDTGPLAGLHGMRRISLAENRVSDVSAFSAMRELEQVNLNENDVTDIGGLTGLTNLRWLHFRGNRIANLSPLGAVNHLSWLDLTGNTVSDIRPLVDRAIFGGEASAGAFVNLDGNPLDETSVEDHIPTLQSWGVHVRFTRRGSDVAAVAFVDPTLRALVAEALAGSDLHVDDGLSRWPIDRLRVLRIFGRGIADLTGLEAAQGLTTIQAASNRIADLSPLAALPELANLDLRDNRIVDLSPLVANDALSAGDSVALSGNPLSEESLKTNVPTLLARGVAVSIDSVVHTLVAGGAPMRFDTAGYFEAVLGSGVSVAAELAAGAAARAEMDGRVLVVTPDASPGSATVTVTASGQNGATETLVFIVTIRGPWRVPLFPTTLDPVRQGFVRVTNHGREAGSVRIVAVDDAGVRHEGLRLSVGAGATVHFNSTDLEAGNPDKGLTGMSGRGFGDWRLALESTLDLAVLSYIRTVDGFLTAMHDVAPGTGTDRRVPTFNPASNIDQVSSLRLTNLGNESIEALVTGVDDRGESPGSGVRIEIPAGATRTLTATDLEVGTDGGGALGDGRGKWRLRVKSSGPLAVTSLLASPEGHLTNLSAEPSASLVANGVHTVPLFPSAADVHGRQGFVRITNRSRHGADVVVRPYDDAGRRYAPLTLAVDPGQTVHFNSDDLELGNADKGLTGSTGSGTGDWRLEFRSDADIQVLSYIRTPTGFLTTMHEAVERRGRRHDVATFNPASNVNQTSKLRIVNAGSRPAHVSIAGVDDRGASPGDVVQLTIAAGTALTLTAGQLERGDHGLQGAIGDGVGKWRLLVDCEQPILVMNLLESRTGHLTNLSTSPSGSDAGRW